MFALGLMTIISVGIGFMFKQVPDAIKGSVPVGEYLGIALLIYFGLRTLKVRCTSRPESRAIAHHCTITTEHTASPHKRAQCEK